MKISIKQRITLLCALLIALVATAALWIMLVSEHQLMNGYYRDTLLSTHQLAADDILYLDGELEIDRNLDELPNVRVALFNLNGDLIYGRTRFELPFEEGDMRHAAGMGNTSWFVMDRLLSFEEGESLWLRCYMSADVENSMRIFHNRTMLLLLPLLVLAAGLGGYVIAKRAMRPVGRIVRTAETIADGSDLKKRIAPTGPKDELHALGRVFDDMLVRLDDAFERERRFTSDASHELRTPVTSILLQSEFALSDAASEEDRMEALREIHGKAQGMSELIKRLMLLARMDAGQMPLAREDVDLGMMAEITVQLLEEQAEPKNIRIETEIDGEIHIQGDQTMLMQVLRNLAENAVRYGRSGGFVRIGLRKMDDAVHIVVEDDGQGIAEEHLEHIFERFYQADSARHGAGSGLGLSLAERIIRLHGGSIRAESRLGSGSRFTVILPMEVDS